MANVGKLILLSSFLAQLLTKDLFKPMPDEIASLPLLTWYFRSKLLCKHSISFFFHSAWHLLISKTELVFGVEKNVLYKKAIRSIYTKHTKGSLTYRMVERRRRERGGREERRREGRGVKGGEGGKAE